MCYAEGRLSYIRRKRHNLKNTLKKLSANPSHISDFERSLDYRPNTKGCHLCSYCRKYSGYIYTNNDLTKIKRHHSNVMRNTYRTFRKIKLNALDTY